MSSEFNLVGIDYVLGSHRIDIEADMPIFKEAIEKTGVRFVYESSVSNIELGSAAANKLLTRLGVDRKTIDCLIVVTQSSERRLPGISSEIQNDVGLRTDLFAIDLNQGCSGFVQGMLIAISLLSQFKNVLLVTTDTYRDKLNVLDRSTNSLFSDAASASLFVQGNEFSLDAHSHITDGSKSELLMERPNLINGKPELFMSGSDIFLWTRKVVALTINSMCDDGINPNHDEIVVFAHQASKLVIDSLQEKTKPKSHFITNYQEIGNTVSSSIPILIADNWSHFAEKVSLCIGFGVGLSLSAALVTPASCKSN